VGQHAPRLWFPGRVQARINKRSGGCFITPRHGGGGAPDSNLGAIIHGVRLIVVDGNIYSTLSALHDEVVAGNRSNKWKLVDGLIVVDGKVYLLPSSPSLQAALALAHGIGHEGVPKTLHWLRFDFFVPGAQKMVHDFVRACTMCPKNEIAHLHPAGLLQPLDVPSTIWADVAMDFVEGFSCVNDKSVILIVVDRLCKYEHFIPLRHPYSGTTVARVFFDTIVRLHGIPSSW
jgi:hypothetical protein